MNFPPPHALPRDEPAEDEIVDPVDRAGLSGRANDMAGAINAVHGVAYMPKRSSASKRPRRRG
jgi:hypothetical protein